jgi:arylsulfatase A-like enzyme
MMLIKRMIRGLALCILMAGGFPAHAAGVDVETAALPSGFTRLALPPASGRTVTGNQTIHRSQDLAALTDGQLDRNYGPVFANGVQNGAYKMDLGAVMPVAAVTSWSYNMGTVRGAQKLTVYGSSSLSDPGWDLTAFVPLGTIDTTGEPQAPYTAASVRTPDGTALGEFRWILWAVSPVTATGGGENTSFQEFSVEAPGGQAAGAAANVASADGSGAASLRVRGGPAKSAKPVPYQMPVVSDAERSRPNIIFILADDMGVGDVSHTSGLAPTPHIDRMAAEGMRFTDAHTASSVCTPSRYSLLTGRYNWRTRLTAHVFSDPHCAPLIEPGEPTVASFLKDNGYYTACIGKWHLGIQWQLQDNYVSTKEKPKGQGWDIDFSKPALITPTSHGFDSFYGITASLDMPPYLFIENEQAVVTELTAKKGGRSGPQDAAFQFDGVLQRLAEKSVAYIDERAKEKKPFFLYLPLTSPHTPIVPSSAWQGKSGLGKYGDFLMETDWVVGEVLAALDQNGLADNTLVVFSTDNGCSPAANIPNLISQGHKPSGDYRGNKADIYDGGHRVPFIVRWPVVVPPGTETRRLTCLTDFIRTCSDILGVELADHAGVDSVSFLPTLNDPSKTERDAVVHHSINGSFALRQGDWKLALCKGSGGWSAPKPGDSPADAPAVQLFNLAEDVGETRNLEADYPERVKAMTELLKKYVENGRSTEGAGQPNATEVNIYALPRKM